MYLLVVLHIIRFVKNAFLNIDAFHFKNENILLLNMCFYKVIKLKYGKVQKVFHRFRISLKDVTCFELFAVLFHGVGVTQQLKVVALGVANYTILDTNLQKSRLSLSSSVSHLTHPP